MKTKTSGLLSIFFIICIIQSCTNNNASKKISDSNGYINLNSGACYFDDIDSIEKKTRIKIDTPSKREVQEIKDIMAYAGLPQNFTVYRGDISNAMATTIGNQRLIVYNKDLFTRMDGSDSSYWSSLFILAHEIGHHLAYNISDTSNFANAELDADIFAASILYRMGADSNQVISAVSSRYISTKKDTQTHPSKDRRIAAVKQSWYKASELRYQSAVPPPPVDEPYYYWGDDISLDKESFYDSTIAAWSGGLSDTTENISKNVEGIILDIVPLNDGTNGKTVKVLITNVDSAHNNLCLYKNKTIDMWVQFFGIAYEKDQFKIFLKPGRRFTFSVVDLHYAYYYLVGVGKK